MNVRHQHNVRISKIALATLFLHIPVFTGVAQYFETEQSIAVGLSLLLWMVPLVTHFMSPGSNLVLNLLAITTMLYSGILIHLGRGMIEMHFHVFTFLAVISVFGLYMPVILATTTIAVHHIAFFFLLPKSVFNYDASFGIVVIHATFVIVETLPALYIAGKFKRMLEVQQLTQTELKSIVDNLSHSGSTLVETVSSLMQSSQTQNSAITSCSSAVTEIQATLQQNSIRTKNVESATKQIEESSHRGKETLSLLQDGMQKIQSSKDLLNSLEEQFTIVNQKTSMIHDIVFQTKILSFNASLEAARAGEAGRSFSVVAEEISALAQTSSKAAQEIDKILSAVKDKVSVISQDFSQNIDSGQVAAEKTASVLEEISNQLSTLNQSMSSVVSDLVQESQGIDEVSRSVVSIESASSNTLKETQRLESLAQNMKELNSKVAETVERAA